MRPHRDPNGERAREGKFDGSVEKREQNAFVCVPNYHSSQHKVTFTQDTHTDAHTHTHTHTL